VRADERALRLAPLDAKLREQKLFPAKWLPPHDAERLAQVAAAARHKN